MQLKCFAGTSTTFYNIFNLGKVEFPSDLELQYLEKKMPLPQDAGNLSDVRKVTDY